MVVMEEPVWIFTQGDWKRIDKKIIENNQFEACNNCNLATITNLTTIPHLHEPAILEAINSRYNISKIYTYTGRILISVNPFQDLGIYSPSIIKAYLQGRATNPHCYQTTATAYKKLLQTGKNQTILVSGESGAGKTHTTRVMMKYLAICSDNGSTIEDKVIEANPILEAFGNACTTRNHNSSRFGKFIKMWFTNGQLSGADITVYLLEKTRTIKLVEGERNFHIFYQLLAGLTLEQKQRFHLTSANNYAYLNYRTDKASEEDAEQFGITLNALKIMGFSQSHIDRIFMVIVAILHLGNVTFNEQGEIITRDVTEMIAKLLDINHTLLTTTLQYRTIVAGHETYKIHLDNAEATSTRDSLAMGIYKELFIHIVTEINRNISGQGKQFIGILDIFGFESFPINRFEQLCINYTNESLQQQFNKYIFKQEQLEYEQEGLDWKRIKFPDNTTCLELIEAKGGIINRLDEECKIPKGNDRNFTRKAIKAYEDRPCFSFDRKHIDSRISIQHYAGIVEYQTKHFCSKNKDYMSLEIATCINAIPLLDSTVIPSTRVGANTVIVQFRRQLHALMKVIKETESHYIRCIKPNDLNIPMSFNRVRVNEQLRYSGVLEAVRVARAGYPIRFFHKNFIEKYGIIAQKSSKSTLSIVALVGNLDKMLYAIGKTKVFLRDGAYEFLETTKDKIVTLAVVQLQSLVRRKILFIRFQKLKKTTILLQSVVRMQIARRVLIRLQRERAATLLQTTWRSRIVMNKYLVFRDIIIEIQRAFRYRKIQGTHSSAIRIQNIVRGWICHERYRAMKVAALIIQKAVRFFLRRRQDALENMRKLINKKEQEHRQEMSRMQENVQLFRENAERDLKRRMHLSHCMEKLLQENKRLKEQAQARQCIIS